MAADDDALLDAIFAAPDDPGPKSVYADRLMERGDPRGELIALQLSGDPAAAERIDGLVSRHGAAWAGPLAPWFRKPDFVDGFFAGGQWSGVQPAFDASPPHIVRHWRLVRTLRSPRLLESSYGAAITLLLADDPHLSGLRTLELWRPGLHALTELAEGKARSLATLAIDDPLDLPAQFPSLPHLRTIAFAIPAPRIAVHLEYARTLTGIETVEVASGPRWLQRYTRSIPGGPFSRLALRCHAGSGIRTKEWAALLANLLPALPGGLEHVTVLGPRRELVVATRDAIERGLRRVGNAYTVPW